MNQSTHYNLNLVEGTDIVNPLVQDVPNYEAIDEAMYNNKIASIGTATELASGVVHALTRATSDTPVFRFTATSNFNSGETFTVDGVQVTALTPSGETLVSGAYIIGSEVLCALRDTLLTVFVSGQAVADNALNLNGHPDTYFGTADDVAQAQATATASGVLAQSVQSQVNTLSTSVNQLDAKVTATDRNNMTVSKQIVRSGDDIDLTNVKYYMITLYNPSTDCMISASPIYTPKETHDIGYKTFSGYNNSEFWCNNVANMNTLHIDNLYGSFNGLVVTWS